MNPHAPSTVPAPSLPLPPASSPAPARRIAWDLFEEHLDESIFLWGEWQAALVAAVYTVAEVAEGPEERLLAHLDALVLGGKPVAEKLLLPALGGDDPAAIAAAAWALLAAEHGDHFDDVLSALAGAEGPAAAALMSAFRLSRRPGIAARLAPLWLHASPSLRAALLDIIGAHDLTWAKARVGEAFHTAFATSEWTLASAALRILRRAPEPAFAAHAEYLFAAQDDGVRTEAILTGALLGSRTAWEAARTAAQGPPGPSSRVLLALLGVSPTRDDDPLIFARLKDAEMRGDALWALGFVGTAEAADAAVAMMAIEDAAPLAGEAFTAITGLPIEGRYARPAPPRAASADGGPEPGDVGLDDPPPVVKPEDHLPAPNPDTVAAWWRNARPGLAPGARYVYGQPRRPDVLQAALAVAPMWRRPRLAFEAAAATKTETRIDERAWAREQMRSLGATDEARRTGQREEGRSATGERHRLERAR